MSQQYWTAYVYASIDVFERAWAEFTSYLHDDAYWDYCHEGDTQWLLTRTRDMDSSSNEGHQGEIGHNRYSSLERSIERIEEEIEEERRRLEEEQRRREEEERARKMAANANINRAIEQARKALETSDFEHAESILAAQATLYNQYKNDLSLADYHRLEGTIQNEKQAWVDDKIEKIQNHISGHEWDQAKTRIDGLKPERVSATGSTAKVQTLRDRLNKEKQEWEAAERERLRLEKIANEKRAHEMVLEHLENWSPFIDEGALLVNKTGFEVFLVSLKSNDDWLFCNEHDSWMDNKQTEVLKRKADTLYSDAKEGEIGKILSELVATQISRENILSDEFLAGNYNPMVRKEMEEVLINGIAKDFTNVKNILEANQFNLPRSIIEDFTILYVDARSAYIEEQIKEKNQEFAKAMIGKALKLQESDDFVSMVADSYIGQHKIRMYVTENGVEREVEQMQEMIHHIEAGSNMVIILEECYDTDVELDKGHIKNSKIFE